MRIYVFYEPSADESRASLVERRGTAATSFRGECGSAWVNGWGENKREKLLGCLDKGEV